MAEIDTVQAQTVPESPAPAPDKGKKKDGKKVTGKLIAAAVAVAVLAGCGFALHKFLTGGESQGDIYSEPVMLGSIQSKVSGSGTASATDSAAITLSQSGTVREVLVNVGDTVTAGQPLYSIYSEKAEDAVSQAQQNYDKKLKEIEKLRENRAELTVRAPFSGKLTEVKEFIPGEDVAPGTSVATLVNDKKLKLSLYFSYAYEKEITVGKAVEVSVPTVMRTFTGKVEELHKVSYISPEGAAHFEAVIVFDNPGTLTADMEASATLKAADGTRIYPYKNGKTQFYEVRPITTKAGGPLVSTGNLYNYANVKAGEALLTMGAENMDEELDRLNEELAAAQTALEEASQALANFNAVAPIDGTVLSCTLTEGAEVKENETVIIISNNTTMQVVIQVDDRNISFVKPGSMVELKWNENMYMGTVTKIDMAGAQKGQGMTNYPVTLTVDNTDGSLMEGAWLQYSFVTSESVDCLTVPAGSVQYFSDMEGNRQTVVFVRRDSRPEDVPELELPTFEPGQPRTFPSEEEGFYPVLVETGLSDIQRVEILSGLEEGDDVFLAYTVEDSAGAW